MPFRLRAVPVSTVLALAAVARPGSADILGTWVESAPNLYEFSYKVTTLPDFDQVRSGLPGCGLNYCVPTTTADLLAYIANHGFPEVAPGPADWQSPANYTAATNAIKSFGVKMSTSAGSGTVKSDWYASLAFIPPFYTTPLLPASKFTVTAMFAKGEYRPRLYAAAKSAILNKGLLSLCHGWYKPIFCEPGQPDLRDGGHCLAVKEIKGYWHKGGGVSPSEYAATVKLRDPAADEGSTGTGSCGGALAPNSQSIFASRQYPLWLHSFYAPDFGGACLSLGRLDRLLVCGPQSCDADELFRLVDAYLMISTKSAYAFTDDFQPILLLLKPIKLTAETPEPTVQNLGTLPPISSAALSADLSEILVVAKNQVHVFDPLAGGLTPLPEGDYVIDEARQVVVGRHRGLYVLDGNLVSCIELDGDVPIMVAQVEPPFQIDAMVYDDRTDEVILLSGSSGKLIRYPWTLVGKPAVLELPAGLPLEGPLQVAVGPSDGSLWIGAFGASAFVQVHPTDPDLTASILPLPPGSGAIRGFDVFDDGNLLASLGAGELHEFEVVAGALAEVLDSPFAGLPGGSIVRATHSRTNLTVGVHDTPAWNDVFPPSFAPAVDVCVGDLDGNGIVNGADLAILLGGWGNAGPGLIADLDGSGLVNGADLALLLGAWGICVPAPEVIVLNQDDCPVAPLIAEGTFDIETTLATTDGPPLPASCNEGSGLSLERDVWATYLPSATGIATVTTCGMAGFDTRLAAYEGFCNALTLIACNDDAAGCPGFTSRMSVPVSAGTPVKIRIGGYGGSSGTGAITISLQPTINADACADAVPVIEGSFPFDTTLATTDGPPLPASCDEGSGLSFGNDVWLRYTPSATGLATISTCNAASYDTRLAAYSGPCGALTLLACNDDAPGCSAFSSTMTVPVVANSPIRIRVGGFSAAAGSGTVTISIP